MGVARAAAAAALVLALAACGDVNVKRSDNDYEEWTHPTKDAMDIRAERADCERFHGSSASEIDTCLKAKGWQKRPSKSFF
ncbi:MAG: hypothetical protein ACM30H_08090 [Clostridia bacterium]